MKNLAGPAHYRLYLALVAAGILTLSGYTMLMNSSAFDGETAQWYSIFALPMLPLAAVLVLSGLIGFLVEIGQNNRGRK